mmetsp:Transcript_67754/g.100426  ORF Transcript_67754/g.100426 Transcript_67754/m.100426 type:complete len:85 (-) Transcript_67754:50-304(-)
MSSTNFSACALRSYIQSATQALGTNCLLAEGPRLVKDGDLRKSRDPLFPLSPSSSKAYLRYIAQCFVGVVYHHVNVFNFLQIFL